MSKPEPERESSSSGIDVRSRESQSSSANSYSTATTPASLYETDDYYPWSPSGSQFSPTSTDSMGRSRVLSNRAADSEIITSFVRSSSHVAGTQPPPRKASKRIAEVVVLSVLILGVLSLFSIPTILHFYVSCITVSTPILILLNSNRVFLATLTMVAMICFQTKWSVITFSLTISHPHALAVSSMKVTCADSN